MKIDPKITIEDLVKEYPASVQFLMEKGIRCLICGEPIWGTLEEAAREKGYSDADIQNLTRELEMFLNGAEN